ncbi:hypothetical protein IHE61_27875 [Streptomyces sp. GKU 257-1]|nr:hypothetical protein [Streptomyces sp. GKU 257-1]
MLTRAPWVEWTELIGMLRAGLAHAGGPPAGESPTDVPLGDLPALARALSALVGGAITIEDPDSRVLAFSPTEHGSDPLRRQTILGQQVPPLAAGRADRQRIPAHPVVDGRCGAPPRGGAVRRAAGRRGARGR